MFGYVRPFRPYLRVCENEGYKSIYCGLCKSIGRSFGLVPRFTLSYDLTFLAIMDMSVNEVTLTAKPKRCIAHPFKKRSCADCSASTDYAAYVSILLVYHKLMDDLSDKGIKSKLRATLLLPFFDEPYKKAAAKYPKLAAGLERLMREQRKLEEHRTDNIDAACEPTARMMRLVFSEIAEDKAGRKLLGRFGYFLGKYIYLTDALDDLKKDAAAGAYNPLLGRKHRLTDGEYDKIAADTQFLVNMVLGQLAEAYDKLGLKMYSGITDNIVYLGLPDVFKRVREGRFDRVFRIRKDDEQ